MKIFTSISFLAKFQIILTCQLNNKQQQGNDIIFYPSVDGPEQCSVMCQDHPECEAWNYHTSDYVPWSAYSDEGPE